MPADVSGKSSGLKTPYYALDIEKDLDPNEALPDQRGKSIEKSDFDNNDDRKEVSQKKFGLKNLLQSIKMKILSVI